jgi:hypothetical protein
MKKYCSYHEEYHDMSKFAKNKANKDGLANICKTAKYLYNRGVRKNDPLALTVEKKIKKRVVKKTGVTKYCSKCKNDIDTSMFTHDKNTHDKLSAYCKDCAKDYRKKRKYKGYAMAKGYKNTRERDHAHYSKYWSCSFAVGASLQELINLHTFNSARRAGSDVRGL